MTFASFLKMHKLFLNAILFVLIGQAALAQPIGFENGTTSTVTPTDTLSAQFADFFAEEEKPQNLHEQGFALRIRVLERYTDTTEDFKILPQEAVIYRNTLMIRAESCVTDFDDIPGNDGGYLAIENRDGDQLFKGWVFKSFPSLTVFEHPDYDVLVLGCSVQ